MGSRLRLFILLIFCTLASLSCRLAPGYRLTVTPNTPPTNQPSIAHTPTLLPSLPPTNAVSPSPTSQPLVSTSSPPSPPKARVRVQAINLRLGPGTLFPVLANLTKDTWVTVQGKALGDEWLWVESDQGPGWLATVFTDLYQNPLVIALPIIPFNQGYVVQGQVKDQEGMPIGGVVFGVTQGNPPQQPRAEATSLPDGAFYVYLPSTAIGKWRLSLVGVDCSSPVMDDSCNYSGEFEPLWADVDIPQNNPLLITYTP